MSRTGKAVHKGNFIILNACVGREERSQMNNLILHLKKLEKNEQNNPKLSKRKKILKVNEKKNEKWKKEKWTEKINELLF